jgi:hypothetical protein
MVPERVAADMGKGCVVLPSASVMHRVSNSETT